MKKIGIFLIFIICGSFVAPLVFAQKAVDPTFYSAIQQRLAVEDYLRGRDPTSLTQEEIQAMLTQAVVTSQIPLVGDIIATASSAIAMTGLAGTAQGMLLKGLYEVTIDPIQDIAVRAPREVLVHAQSENLIPIAMQEKKGKGSVSYGSVGESSVLKQVIDRFWKSIATLFARIVPSERLTQQPGDRSTGQEVAGVAIATVPVTVRLYRDINANGIYDEGDKPVPWAQVPVRLRKVSREQSLALTSGMNTIRFEILPLNMPTTYDLLAQIAAGGVREATIVRADGGVPVSVTAKGTELFGPDFPLAPGRPYLVYVTSPVTLFQIFR